MQVVAKDMKARLEELIGDKKPYSWATEVGIPGGSFHKIWNLGGAPLLSHLEMISDHEGVTIDWLVKGEGPKYRKDVCREADPVWTGPVDDAQALDDLGGRLGRFIEEYSLVPRYAVEVSAGHGSFLENDERPYESMAFRRQWVKRMGLTVDRLAVVTARGDSMEPTVADGDVLLVDLRQTGIVDGAIHVLRNNGDVLVKRLQRGFGDQVIVRSDNTIYRELEATVDQLNVVGRVVWRGGRM